MTTKAFCYIDGRHVSSLLRGARFVLDYKRLLDEMRRMHDLRRIYFFTSTRPVVEEQSIVNLLTWLRYNGITVVTREVHEEYHRTSMVPEMIVTMMEHAGHAEEAYIFSGDSSLTPCVRSLKMRGQRITVVSEISECGDDLRRECDEFQSLAGVWVPRVGRESVRRPETVGK